MLQRSFSRKSGIGEGIQGFDAYGEGLRSDEVLGYEEVESRTIVLDQHHGLERRQRIIVGNTADGKPKPLLALSFDGVILKTANNYRRATRALVLRNARNDAKVPSLIKFKRRVFRNEITLTNELCFYKWGVSRKLSVKKVWEDFRSLVHYAESHKPSEFFPTIAGSLPRICENFHVVIVTRNSIHPIAEIIKARIGISVDVVVIKEGGKDRVLGALSKTHQKFHRPTRTPFYFFSDTPQDMHDALECGGPIYSIGVVAKEFLRYDHFMRKWKSNMTQNGANGLVTHDKILPASLGQFRPRPSLLK